MAKKKKAASEDREVDRDDSEDLKGGPGKWSRKFAVFWKKSIEDVEELYDDWYERGDSVITRFRDDRRKNEMMKTRKLNTLWANYKILMPAVYGRAPVPICERRYLQHDPVGRTSAVILERNIKYQMDVNGLHLNVKRAVGDYLLPGRGTVWVRYEPEIGQGDSIPTNSESGIEDEINDIYVEKGDIGREDDQATEKLESTGEQLLSEQAPVDYIQWKDFLMMPVRAKTWDEVQAIAKKVPISRKEAIERFGKEIGEALPRDTEPLNSKRDRNTTNTDAGVFHDLNERSIIIYEIWNRTDRRVYWICKGYDYLCEVKDDPLKLKKFFPVPEPLSATITNDSLIPVPDYFEYQDQAIQIDEITQRLAMLTKACKIAGTYDANNGPLKRLLQEGFENDLLPVDSWAAFAEKGGVKGGISFLPVDEIQKVIQTLTGVRQQLMQDLDLVSGISDVNRGTTDSRETLGGIRLKNNNTGTRLSDRQNEVARFARDVVAIVGEIVAKHFSDETLIEASSILLDDDMQPKQVLEDMMEKMQGGPQPQMPPNPMMGPSGGPPLAGGQQMLGALGGLHQQMPPQQPPNNVVPFPGMQQPPNPMMGMGQPNPMMGMFPPAPPPMPDPTILIQEKLQKSIDLLRKDVPLGYRIDIETDSTIFGDAAQERKDATEFIQSATQFLGQAAQIVQTIPESMPLFGRMLQWGVRKFRVGRDLEGAIDRFVEAMEKKSKQAAKNPQPSPEAMKAQSEQKANELKLQQIQAQNQADKEKTQMEMQAQQSNDARDAQKQQAEDQREAQIAQMEMEHKQQEMMMEMEFKKADHQMKMTELNAKMHQSHQDHQLEVEKQAHETQQMHEQNQIKREQMHTQHAIARETSEMKIKESKAAHTQKMQQAKAPKKKASK